MRRLPVVVLTLLAILGHTTWSPSHASARNDRPRVHQRLVVVFIRATDIGGDEHVDAYNYIEERHPGLWMVEANSTYRGWFVGGNQSGEWGNRSFVSAHVTGRGALGDFFATMVNGAIKMGDSPSVGYLLRNTLEDPSMPGWGGQFVRVWDGRKTVFDHLTTEADTVEAFGVVEFALPAPEGKTRDQSARMIFDGRIAAIADNDGRTLRFRFSPRDAKVWTYVIRSRSAALDGRSGRFNAVPAPPGRAAHPSARHPHWWTDDQSPAAAEDGHAGARSVSRWREQFLRDFAERLVRTSR